MCVLCVFVNIYIYTYTYTHTHTHTHIHLYCVLISPRDVIYVCMYVCIHTYVCMYVYIRMYVCIYLMPSDPARSTKWHLPTMRPGIS